MWEASLAAVLIFLFRLCDVSLGTVRMILAIQGRKVVAAFIGFVEVSVFVLAIGQVMAGGLSVGKVLAYSGGFAAGTMLGIVIENWLAMGYRLVRVITHRPGDHLIECLRDDGFGVTRIVGEGKEGRVYVLLSVVRRRNLRRYMGLVNKLAPKAFVTIEETREARYGYIPHFTGRVK